MDFGTPSSYLVISEEAFGGDVRLFSTQHEAEEYVNVLRSSKNIDAIAVSFPLMTSRGFLTVSEKFYGGLERNEIRFFTSQESAKEWMQNYSVNVELRLIPISLPPRQEDRHAAAKRPAERELEGFVPKRLQFE